MQSLISLFVNCHTETDTLIFSDERLFGFAEKRVAHRNEPPVKGGQNEAL